MAKITITNDELVEFRRAAQGYINRYPDRTKLHYALEKALKRTQLLFEDYADAENDIRVDCAVIDEKTKTFVLNEMKNGMAIDPSKAKELQQKMRVLGRKEVSFEPYFATEVAPELEAMWFQAFNGIVIKDDPLEESKMTVDEK